MPGIITEVLVKLPFTWVLGPFQQDMFEVYVPKSLRTTCPGVPVASMSRTNRLSKPLRQEKLGSSCCPSLISRAAFVSGVDIPPKLMA